MLHESNPSRLFFNYPFHLKYIFHFSHRYLHDTCPLESLVPLIQSIISSWTVSTHSILSHILGDNGTCSCSFLYLSPTYLLLPPIDLWRVGVARRGPLWLLRRSPLPLLLPSLQLGPRRVVGPRAPVGARHADGALPHPDASHAVARQLYLLEPLRRA